MTTAERRCEFCEASLDGRDPRARFCDHKCRRAAWAEKHGYGHQRGEEVRSNGLPAAAVSRNADRMRARRAAGRVASDKRISFSRAVTAAAGLVRQVARVSEKDAQVLADDAMNAALPDSWRTPHG